MTAFPLFYSRASFLTILACAAVVPFIIRPHAAKAYPTVAPLESGVHPILRSYKQYSLLPSEPGIISTAETAQSWLDPDSDGPSVIYYQSKLLPSKGHLSPSTPDDGPHHKGVTYRGQGLGGVRPAGSIHSDPQPSRVNHNLFVQKNTKTGGPSGFVAPHNGNSQSGYHSNWHPPILRKYSQQERPLPQSASQVETQRPYEFSKIPSSDMSMQSKSRSEDRTVWHSPSSVRTSGYWSSQIISKERYGDNKESAGGAALRTRGIHLKRFPHFFSPSSPFMSSFSGSLDSSVIKPEKLTSSSTASSRGVFPKSNDKSVYRRVQSYFLRNSHTSNTPKGVNTHIFPHYSTDGGQDLNQQKRAKPNLFSTSTVLIRNATHNRFDRKMFNDMKDQSASIIYRAAKKDALTPQNLEKVQANSANEEVEDVEDAHGGNRGHALQPSQDNNRQPKESSYPSGEHTQWPLLKKNSQPPIILNKEANSESRSYRFMRPSMLQKYSFGQRIASNTSTSRRFLSDILDATATTVKSLPFQEVPLNLYRPNSTNSNSGSVYKVYKRPEGHEIYQSHSLSAGKFNQMGNDNYKSGHVRSETSTEEQNRAKSDPKGLEKSAQITRLVTVTRIKPSLVGFKLTTPQPLNGQHAQAKDVRNVTIFRQPKLKAVTYYDIIGSASFSSFTPTGTSQSRDHFDNSMKTMTLTKAVVPHNRTVNLTDVKAKIVNTSRSHKNGTEVDSVTGNKLDFKKELETELKMSDLIVKETESEAQSVPRGFLSDRKENVRENLLELDYLRTSTGNVSFQSINLNL